MKGTPILVELWRFRGLLRSLVVRDLKVKYQRSLLGLIWTLLNPLLTVAILVTVFTYVDPNPDRPLLGFPDQRVLRLELHPADPVPCHHDPSGPCLSRAGASTTRRRS